MRLELSYNTHKIQIAAPITGGGSVVGSPLEEQNLACFSNRKIINRGMRQARGFFRTHLPVGTSPAVGESFLLPTHNESQLCVFCPRSFLVEEQDDESKVYR